MSLGPGACCVPCKTYFAPAKNDINVLETFEDGRPYQIWKADLLECPDCGHQIVKGYAGSPVSAHFNDNFGEWMKRVNVTIIGCPRRLPNIKPGPLCST